jgi:hypothetical protein
MRMKPTKAKIRRLEKLAEEAMIDCYNDWEVYAGWACTIEDNLPLPLKCSVLGEEATLVAVEPDDSGTAVLGVVKRKGKKLRMPVQDIEPLDKRVKGLEWIDAYRHWLGISERRR